MEQKNKINQPNPVDHLWKVLKSANALNIEKNSLCTYDKERNFFTVPVFNDTYRVFPSENKVVILSSCGQNVNETPVGFKELGFEFFLVLLGYLTGSVDLSLDKKWISEKEIKGGEVFFRGPHVVSISPIVKKFEGNIEEFIKVGNKLSGTPDTLGDVSFVFDVFPRVPLLYLLWGKDEEFAGRAQILFDKSIEKQMSLDLVWAMTRFCTKKIISC